MLHVIMLLYRIETIQYYSLLFVSVRLQLMMFGTVQLKYRIGPHVSRYLWAQGLWPS